MSTTHETDAVTNSGYGSSDETATLLEPQVTATLPKPLTSSNGPTSTSTSPSINKPVLIRQDRTSTYLASPQLSNAAAAEEGNFEEGQGSGYNVPDVEMQCRTDTPKISISNSCHDDDNSNKYQLTPTSRVRSVAQTKNERRSSVVNLPRTSSKESIQSGGIQVRLSPHMVSKQHSTNIPPVLISSPNSNRIIRQSSQPESSHSCTSTCAHGQSPQTSSSLRQLKSAESNNSDGRISGIAAETMRINGAMRPFKQVS